MSKNFKAHRHPDGRYLLNLGSSARVADGWNNVDFSLILRISKFQALCVLLHKIGIIDSARFERIKQLRAGTHIWDLRRGIPFAANSFDVVYHSHVLEHIDREHAPRFISECHRVLKPGGVIRIVVPDLEVLGKEYVRQLSVLENLNHLSLSNKAQYYQNLERILDQMVPKVPRERLSKPFIIRQLEHIFLGDTNRSGTLHRWMYDRFSLGQLLVETGFTNIKTYSFNTSRIKEWSSFYLDNEPDGKPYKNYSLYIEGNK